MNKPLCTAVLGGPMSGSKQDNGADRIRRPAVNGQTDPADDNQANQGTNGTLGADGPAGSDVTTAASRDPVLPPAAAAPQASVADRATAAGVAAAKAVWSQAATLIPLLALASYGLGRLMEAYSRHPVEVQPDNG